MTNLTTARIVAASLRVPTGDGLTAPDVADLIDELADALESARSLRLDHPSAAVNRAVHTPGRVTAHLRALGFEAYSTRRTASCWAHGTRPDDFFVSVPLIPTASDYCGRVGILAAMLADKYGTGELQVLADIADAGDV